MSQAYNSIDDLDMNLDDHLADHLTAHLSDNLTGMDSEEFTKFFPGYDTIGLDIMDMEPLGNIKQEDQPQQVQQQDLQAQIQTPIDITHLSRIPNLETVQTAYEFEVTVPPDANIAFNREKLFVKKGTKMTMNVAYKQISRGEQLFVRAMLLFSKPAEMHLPVKCCANHRVPATANAGWSSHELSAWASIVKINDPKAVYVGFEDKGTFQDRLSILVPLESNHINEDGKYHQSIGLEFGCQNSCSSGINRRPVLIVFTLESGQNALLGKSVVEFKVCSCPKRDAEREQQDRKRKNESKTAFPRGKRPTYQHAPEVKPEPESDSDESTNGDQNTTPVTVNGVPFNYPTELVPDLLKSAFNIVAGKMAEDSKTYDNHMVKCVKEIKKVRKQFDPRKQ